MDNEEVIMTEFKHQEYTMGFIVAKETSECHYGKPHAKENYRPYRRGKYRCSKCGGKISSLAILEKHIKLHAKYLKKTLGE